MAAPVTAIHSSMEGPEREAEILRLIAEKEEQIEALKDMLPVDPNVTSERVHFDVTAFVEGDPLERDRRRDLIHTALSMVSGVGVVELVSSDLPKLKATAGKIE
jgi:hypothetical protein